MKISGFSYIRNGFEFGYPFLQSIQSVLPLVDEFVIAVGDSSDNTREAIEQLNNHKIKIIDTVWDMSLREGGKLFAQQANIALDNITGDIGFHIQADELVHEKDYGIIKLGIKKLSEHEKAEGLLFNFLNFYGGYHHIGITRSWHRREIRIIKNNKHIRSYRDSQGFRHYPSIEEYNKGNPGRKLNVIYIPAEIYHYSYCRHPLLMRKKSNYFNSFWHDDEWLQKNNNTSVEYDYNHVDAVAEFKGTHPSLMNETIAKQDWTFHFDPSKSKFTPKGRFLFEVEKLSGWRIGEYKNYKIIENLTF